MIKYLVQRLMLHSLHRAYRRVCWVGDLPSLPEGRPVVLYANHNTFHDGYVLWLVARTFFRREVLLWMEDWDSFPFFAAVGARPFPTDDATRRMQTIRRTARHLSEKPDTVLIYFPEGELHPPEDGLRAFPSDLMPRLARVFPEVIWWPVGIHLTTHGEALPTLLLTGGTPHPFPDGTEHQRLSRCTETLRSTSHECERLLLGGAHSPDEAWNMRFLRPIFHRYL